MELGEFFAGGFSGDSQGFHFGDEPLVVTDGAGGGEGEGEEEGDDDSAAGAGVDEESAEEAGGGADELNPAEEYEHAAGDVAGDFALVGAEDFKGGLGKDGDADDAADPEA